MLISYFTATEETFQAIQKDLPLDPPTRQALTNLAEGCYELVDDIARQWVEMHPYSLDPKVKDVYAQFDAALDQRVTDLILRAGPAGTALKPLIDYARNFYTEERTRAEKEVPVFSHREVHTLDARIEMCRLIAQWCERLLEKDTRAG